MSERRAEAKKDENGKVKEVVMYFDTEAEAELVREVMLFTMMIERLKMFWAVILLALLGRR